MSNKIDEFNDYNQGFSDGYRQKQYKSLTSNQILYRKGYKDGIIRQYSEKIEIAVNRMIEAQKKGRIIKDFDKNLDYYLKNEF